MGRGWKRKKGKQVLDRCEEWQKEERRFRRCKFCGERLDSVVRGKLAMQACRLGESRQEVAM